MKRYAGIFSLYSSGNRYIKDIIEGYTIIKMKKSAPLLFNLIFILRGGPRPCCSRNARRGVKRGRKRRKKILTKGEWFDRMIKHSSRGEPKGSAKSAGRAQP